MPFNRSLPNITIFATGGTIAGSAASDTATTGYTAGSLGVDILIQAVPELWNVSNVKGVPVANVDSGSITPEILLNLTSLIQEALDDPYCQGAVVTHGTDTMVVLNDRIGSAFYMTKTHSNALDTFKAHEQGYLGFFLDAKPLFYYHPVLPIGRVHFDVSRATELPEVDILFGHQVLNRNWLALR